MVTAFISIPAYRVLFGDLMNFFISLDRWQFYVFHRRNHSYSSWIFLNNIYDLMNMKGTFAHSQMDQYLKFTSTLNSFVNGLDYKT